METISEDCDCNKRAKKMVVDHSGEMVHEVMRMTKAEELEIMLDPSHTLHNKLILIYFLNAGDRGAVAVAMLAIVDDALPLHLHISSVIEVILNADVNVIDTLVGLFALGDYFSSPTALVGLKSLVERTDDLAEFRSHKALQ